jgi:hypothetical protein
MSILIRVWKELDLADIEKHTLIVGELSSDCSACKHIGIDSKAIQCPACATHFKYMAFRRKLEMHYLKKMKDELPGTIFIDFEDYKKAIGHRDARDLFK